MGDAIATPFELMMFVIIFVGMPSLIVAIPGAILIVLAARIGMRKSAEHGRGTSLPAGAQNEPVRSLYGDRDSHRPGPHQVDPA